MCSQTRFTNDSDLVAAMAMLNMNSALFGPSSTLCAITKRNNTCMKYSVPEVRV